VSGCEFSGIHLPLEDFNTVYNIINYDNGEWIDFKKFCLINTDKSNDVHRLIEDLKKERVRQRETLKFKQMEERYHYLLNIHASNSQKIR